MNPETHTCDCGFTWRHGHSGAHSCEPYYRKTIAELRAAAASQVVADERAAFGAWWADFAESHPEWPFADSGALRWEAYQAGRAAAPVQAQKPVLEMLLNIAMLAHDAMDNTEENEHGLHWDKGSFDALSAAMDELESLPDDQPGYVMGPAAKAAWALRHRSPVQPVDVPDSLGVRPDGSQSGDDWHIEQFAKAMSEKMKVSAAKGRHGWNDPDQCSIEDLACMLCQHVLKGDPVDIANFSMMLHQRDTDGERVYQAITDASLALLAAPAAQGDVKEVFRHTGGKSYEKLGELKAKVGDTGWWNAVRYRSLDDGKEYVTDSDRWARSFAAIAAKAAS